MNILLSGSSGLIGRTLISGFLERGYQVTLLQRQGTKESPFALPAITWDPPTVPLQIPSVIEPIHAVIHLAGENISRRRWTSRQKMRILKSRVEGTRSLADGLRNLGRPPSLFLCASAIGYYGSRGDAPLSEEAGRGEGFLAEVSSAWESEALRVGSRETRVALLRFGVVLSPLGGALPQMLKPFQLGLGGKLGNGQQYFSWIALDEIPSIVDHIIRSNALSGPINLVSPSPVRNADLTRILSKVLHRPAFFSVPSFLLRMVLGEMAEELLLASIRVIPEKLLASGYQFQWEDLEITLRQQLRHT